MTSTDMFSAETIQHSMSQADIEAAQRKIWGSAKPTAYDAKTGERLKAEFVDDKDNPFRDRPIPPGTYMGPVTFPETSPDTTSTPKPVPNEQPVASEKKTDESKDYDPLSGLTDEQRRAYDRLKDFDLDDIGEPTVEQSSGSDFYGKEILEAMKNYDLGNFKDAPTVEQFIGNTTPETREMIEKNNPHGAIRARLICEAGAKDGVSDIDWMHGSNEEVLKEANRLLNIYGSEADRPENPVNAQNPTPTPEPTEEAHQDEPPVVENNGGNNAAGNGGEQPPVEPPAVEPEPEQEPERPKAAWEARLDAILLDRDGNPIDPNSLSSTRAEMLRGWLANFANNPDINVDPDRITEALETIEAYDTRHVARPQARVENNERNNPRGFDWRGEFDDIQIMMAGSQDKQKMLLDLFKKVRGNDNVPQDFKEELAQEIAENGRLVDIARQNAYERNGGVFNGIETEEGWRGKFREAIRELEKYDKRQFNVDEFVRAGIPAGGRSKARIEVIPNIQIPNIDLREFQDRLRAEAKARGNLHNAFAAWFYNRDALAKLAEGQAVNRMVPETITLETLSTLANLEGGLNEKISQAMQVYMEIGESVGRYGEVQPDGSVKNFHIFVPGVNEVTKNVNGVDVRLLNVFGRKNLTLEEYQRTRNYVGDLVGSKEAEELAYRLMYVFGLAARYNPKFEGTNQWADGMSQFMYFNSYIQDKKLGPEAARAVVSKGSKDFQPGYDASGKMQLIEDYPSLIDDQFKNDIEKINKDDAKTADQKAIDIAEVEARRNRIYQGENSLYEALRHGKFHEIPWNIVPKDTGALNSKIGSADALSKRLTSRNVKDSDLNFADGSVEKDFVRGLGHQQKPIVEYAKTLWLYSVLREHDSQMPNVPESNVWSLDAMREIINNAQKYGFISKDSAHNLSKALGIKVFGLGNRYVSEKVIGWVFGGGKGKKK